MKRAKYFIIPYTLCTVQFVGLLEPSYVYYATLASDSHYSQR